VGRLRDRFVAPLLAMTPLSVEEVGGSMGEVEAMGMWTSFGAARPRIPSP
jgi:hypothetical protein